jgi:hypothetical protein
MFPAIIQYKLVALPSQLKVSSGDKFKSLIRSNPIVVIYFAMLIFGFFVAGALAFAAFGLAGALAAAGFAAFGLAGALALAGAVSATTGTATGVGVTTAGAVDSTL